MSQRTCSPDPHYLRPTKASLARRKSSTPWLQPIREKRKRSQAIAKARFGEKNFEQELCIVSSQMLVKADPIVEFSRKEVILRTCTPVRPFQGPSSSVIIKHWDTAPKQISMQPSSAFLSLPPEIRNQIYELYFGNRTFRFKDAFAGPHARLNTGNERHILGLLYTCHQVYSESLLLPYSLNTFAFREFDLSLLPFLNHRLVAQFRAITRIELLTYQGERMWAAPDRFSPTFEEMGWLVRLPNLRALQVVVDLMQSLYVLWGTRGFDFGLVDEAERDLKRAVKRLRPDVVVRFRWCSG